jgi:hypothetical protein
MLIKLVYQAPLALCMGLVESSGLRTFSKIKTSAETFLGLFCTSKPFLHHFEQKVFSSRKSCMKFENFPKSEQNWINIFGAVFHFQTHLTSF